MQGTIQTLDHWNFPSTEFLSITMPANCVPRNSPRPIVAAKIRACIEPTISGVA